MNIPASGQSIRRVAAAVWFVFMFVPACGASAQTNAWWITATFVPVHDRIEGIAVKELNTSWKLASLLQPSNLPPEAQEPGESPKDHGFEFALEADIDGDGRRERSVVGVFQTTAGETGRFLLILGRANDGSPWRKRGLLTIAGEAGFSAIAIREGRLQWVDCFDCDTGCEVRRRLGRYKLRCSSL